MTSKGGGGGGGDKNGYSEVNEKIILVDSLLKQGCLKFGQFVLKSGATSEYYIDLRESTLDPSLFRSVVEAIKTRVKSILQKHPSDTKVAISGVPYGVVPLAAAVAYELNLPYYPLRKESKGYGRESDSNLLNDHKFILIEDVMSSGSSIIETVKKLEGKAVTDVIVVANREGGGLENLMREYSSVQVHSILRASDLLQAKDRSVPRQ